jgi:hypothetical protein
MYWPSHGRPSSTGTWEYGRPIVSSWNLGKTPSMVVEHRVDEIVSSDTMAEGRQPGDSSPGEGSLVPRPPVFYGNMETWQAGCFELEFGENTIDGRRTQGCRALFLGHDGRRPSAGGLIPRRGRLRPMSAHFRRLLLVDAGAVCLGGVGTTKPECSRGVRIVTQSRRQFPAWKSNTFRPSLAIDASNLATTSLPVIHCAVSPGAQVSDMTNP